MSTRWSGSAAGAWVVGMACCAAALAAGEPARGAELPAGDAGVGRALFNGARAFQAGGPACGACHAAGGEPGPSGAASLGPELTASFDGLDAAAVDGLLQDLPFPTMAPVFAGRPLTPTERADLGAYLLRSRGTPAPGGGAIAPEAAAIAAGLVALVALAGRRRKRATRAGLVARPPTGGSR